MGRNKKTTERFFRLSLAVAAAVAALAAAPKASLSAMPAAVAADQAALCTRATERWEKISSIPSKLLTAISYAESGRWSEKDRAIRAWPWTVTSGGPGKYFASKAEAMNEVRRLQAMGVQNIDVGCMQVNMQYHGHNFRSLAEAFDPDINAAYAAKYLKQMRESAESWEEAAGYYHSMTPERTAIYRAKIEKFLAQLGGMTETRVARAEPPAKAAPAEPTEPRPAIAYSAIDRERTAALNDRFKTLRAAARKMREELDPELRRQRQMDAWRDARGRAADLQHIVAERQAELARRRADEIKSATALGDRKERFADNRRQQLDRWRLRVAANEPDAPAPGQ